MKQRHWILYALLSAVLLSGCTPNAVSIKAPEEADVDPSPEEKVEVPASPELAAKRIEYRDTMKKVVEILRARVHAGNARPVELLEATVAVAEAELMTAATQEELVTSLKRMLETEKKYEERIKSMVDSGYGNVDHLAMATATRVRIELYLIEAEERANMQRASDKD